MAILVWLKTVGVLEVKTVVTFVTTVTVSTIVYFAKYDSEIITEVVSIRRAFATTFAELTSPATPVITAIQNLKAGAPILMPARHGLVTKGAQIRDEPALDLLQVQLLAGAPKIRHSDGRKDR